VKSFCQTFPKTASTPSEKPLQRRSQSRSRFWRSRSPAKQALGITNRSGFTTHENLENSPHGTRTRTAPSSAYNSAPGMDLRHLIGGRFRASIIPAGRAPMHACHGCIIPAQGRPAGVISVTACVHACDATVHKVSVVRGSHRSGRRCITDLLMTQRGKETGPCVQTAAPRTHRRSSSKQYHGYASWRSWIVRSTFYSSVLAVVLLAVIIMRLEIIVYYSDLSVI
jgi:hypothetical protein